MCWDISVTVLLYVFTQASNEAPETTSQEEP